MRLLSAALLAPLALSPLARSCDAPPDADGDGYPADTDCDDADAATFPGAPEACDDVDNDCDGTADEGCLGPLTPLRRSSGVVAQGSYDAEQSFDEVEETDDLEPFEAEVAGALYPASTCSIEASSWQRSEVSTWGVTAEGRSWIQLQDGRGGCGGSATAVNLFDYRFRLGAETALTVDVQLASDIYERAGELYTFVELSGPHGEAFTDAIVDEEGEVWTLHEEHLPAGDYWLQVESYATSSLSGYWDDYPGTTLTWAVAVTAE